MMDGLRFYAPLLKSFTLNISTTHDKFRIALLVQFLFNYMETFKDLVNAALSWAAKQPRTNYIMNEVYILTTWTAIPKNWGKNLENLILKFLGE